METKEKSKRDLIELTLKAIEKEYGKGAIMFLDADSLKDIEVFDSGSLLLNRALGVPGYPRGRIIEIYGPESAGKTTLSLLAIAQCQKAGGNVAFIDAEHSLDPAYALRLGVSTSELLLSQPDSGEQALDILEMLVRSHALDLVVIDSVAALVPLAEINGEMGEQTIGLQARLMSKALRKLSGAISKSNCTIIFINQIREKIGIAYGNPETTPGGRALRFYSSIRLEVRKGEQLVRDGQIIGHKIKVKTVKNKVAAPFKIANIDFYFEHGIVKENEIISLAIDQGIIKRAAGWYSFKDNNLGQGKEKVLAYLLENQHLLEEISTLIV